LHDGQSWIPNERDDAIRMYSVFFLDDESKKHIRYLLSQLRGILFVTNSTHQSEQPYKWQTGQSNRNYTPTIPAMMLLSRIQKLIHKDISVSKNSVPRWVKTSSE